MAKDHVWDAQRAGERAVERLLTIVCTCQLQQLSALVYFTAAIAAHRRSQPVASLVKRRAAQVRAGFVAERRFAMAVLSAFGLLAALLAGIGLYGVMTYLVQLGTREIGIRMALGASPGALRWQVIRDGLRHASSALSQDRPRPQPRCDS